MKDIVACHYEQQKSDTCLPACVRILLRAQGRETVDEDEILRGWIHTRYGYGIEDAAGFLGRQSLTVDPEDPDCDDWLRVHLKSGWLIVRMFGGILERHSEAKGLRSRFGSLSTSSYGYGPLHEIVLVGADERGYWYLDPYYPAYGQPLHLETEKFLHAWEGGIILP